MPGTRPVSTTPEPWGQGSSIRPTTGRQNTGRIGESFDDWTGPEKRLPRRGSADSPLSFLLPVYRSSHGEADRRAAGQRTATRLEKTAREAEEREKRRREASERWVREGTRLSWDELQAGVACRGCGEPIIDNLGGFPARVKETPEQRKAREDKEGAYQRRHPDCHEAQWTMQGSRTIHCCGCCPPPPLGPVLTAKVAEIFRRPRPPEHEYVWWRVDFRCGHHVEVRRHKSIQYLTESAVDCADCGEVRGVLHRARKSAGSEGSEASLAGNSGELAVVEKEIRSLRSKLRAAEKRRRTLLGRGE